MRRKTGLFLILTFVLIFPTIIYSAEVTRVTAEQVAMNLYSERKMMDHNDFKIIETIIEQDNAENIFYIFNFDKTGFVIVSADDIAVPILGYVFEHNYSTDNHPPQFDAMLASFRDQILFARENDLAPPQETVNKWNRLKVTADMFIPENYRAVGPLLSTTWNQGQFYNESCPSDAGSVPSDPGTPGNGYVWAGCTATATAQVMKYHNHPVTGEGTHSYTHTTYGPQSANFGTTTYSWALMPNNVAAVNPFVHTLLYHVGVGAEMQYGLYGSGAWIGGVHPATALSALQNHFKYDPNSYYDQRSNYTLSAWNSKLQTELGNNRPLVYDGYNIGYSDGHAFVIDGYQGVSNDQYHVNFGWGVSGYNGYYTLDAIYIDSTHDYRYFQAALFGVEPRKWSPLPDVSIDISQMDYTGVDLDLYYEGPTPVTYSVTTDLTGEEFTLAFNGNNELVFSENPTVTSNVNIDIAIRASYSGGTSDDTFNFIITGVTSNTDWGDAPDAAAAPQYPTLLANSGANHTIVAGLQLGSLIDPEPDGQPDATATGDDNDGINDDDGINLPTSLIPGSMANYTASVSTMCILNAWIDFDGNGSWAEPGEQIAANQVLMAGNNPLTFSVPASAATGTTFARFRVNSQGGLSFTGPANDGEVEDYQVTIGEESSLKWEQLPDLSVNGMDVDATNDIQENQPPHIIADDFECTMTGPITNIKVWGSWIYDYLPFGIDPEAVEITLSIHEDIPAGVVEEWSMPGNVLWWRTFYPGEFTAELFAENLQEGWYDPVTGFYLPFGDSQCWLYSFDIETDQFTQLGTPDNPIIYWLDVQARPLDSEPDCRFGWKTSEMHWNDDGVCTVGTEPYSGMWDELIYPSGHELQGQSIDLAFQITTEEEEPPDEYDFGDAPDGQSSIAYPSTGVVGNFPTCTANGAYVQHGFGQNWAWFGPGFDLELDGNAGNCPNCFPTYDDDECFGDGIDAGLLMPESYTIDAATGSVVPCLNGSSLGIICNNAVWGTDIDIDVTNNMPVDGYVNVLVDWNQNGQWQNDATTMCAGVVPEHVLVDFIVPMGHSGPLSTLMVPPLSFQIGPNSGYVWVRFSISEAQVGNDWDGSGVFEDGETEDYLLYIEDEEPEELDFGDADETGTFFPTTLLNDGARHTIIPNFCLGSVIDSEPDGQPDAAAIGDDNDTIYPPANDDEDGIINLTNFVVGQQAIIDIHNTMLLGATGYLDGWVDFNADGDWDDAGEQIFNTFALAGWPSNYNSVFVNTPASAVAGSTVFCRFRMSSTGGLSYNGHCDDGEVEDYTALIIEPFGENKIHHPQWPDTTENGIDIYDEDPIILADDFLCIESGAITEIHFWGSWLNDIAEFNLLSFEVSFWSDIPDPDGAGPLYSMPGTLLWTGIFDYTRYSEEIFITLLNPEWWYNPIDGNLIQSADNQIWHYKFMIDEEEAFIQNEADIYWISIRTFDPTNPDETFFFGWKTCEPPLHWNDDAVWCPGDYNWQELIYPVGHPYNPQSLGLSFYISGVPLPATPINLTITKNSDHIRLDWDAGLPTDQYKVYSSTNPYAAFPFGWTLETPSAISNNYWLDGPPLPGASKKFYRVTAEN